MTWPICRICHIRHDPAQIHFPRRYVLVEPSGRVIFAAAREFCEQRRAHIAQHDANYAARLALRAEAPDARD